MKKWLKTHTHFPIAGNLDRILLDADTAEIKRALEDLQTECERNAKRKHSDPLIVFIYYSGHGIYFDGSCWLIANDGTPLNLDAYIKGCSLGKNTKVIALVDTCHELADVAAEHKGAAVKAAAVHTPGERYVIYSSEPGERAVSSPEGSRISNSWHKLFE